MGFRSQSLRGWSIRRRPARRYCRRAGLQPCGRSGPAAALDRPIGRGSSCGLLVLCAVQPGLIASLTIFAVSGMCAAYRVTANAAFAARSLRPERELSLGLANGGMQVSPGPMVRGRGGGGRNGEPRSGDRHQRRPRRCLGRRSGDEEPPARCGPLMIGDGRAVVTAIRCAWLLLRSSLWLWAVVITAIRCAWLLLSVQLRHRGGGPGWAFAAPRLT